MFHGRMKLGGEHKADADLLDGLGDLFGREVEADAEGREHIGRAAMRGRGAVAMLGNFASRACEDECGGSGNVEGVRAVAACADDVVNGFVWIGEFDLDRVGAHGTDGTCDLGNGLAFHAQRDQIGADLRGRGLTCHDDVHRFFGFVGGEVGAVDGFGDKRFEHGLVLLAASGAGFDIEKILEQLFAVFGENELGMELHAIGRVLAMFERHDLAFGSLRNDFKFGGDGFIDDKRVIAHGFKRRRNIFEDALSVVSDGGSLAVHETRSAVHFAAVDCAETLMPEADAKHGDFAREVFDGFGRDAAIFDGFAWTWGDDKMVRLEGNQFIQSSLLSLSLYIYRMS